MHLSKISIFLLALLVAPLSAFGDASGDSFSAALAALNSDDFEQKAQALTQIETSKDPRALALFQGLLDGTLFQRKEDDKFVYATPTDDGYTLIDALDGAALGAVGKQ